MTQSSDFCSIIIKMLVKFKTFLYMFLKLCSLSHHFIIHPNSNIISLSLSYSVTERIFYSVPKRIFSRQVIYKLKTTVFTMETSVFFSKRFALWMHVFLFLLNERYFSFVSVTEKMQLLES